MSRTRQINFTVLPIIAMIFGIGKNVMAQTNTSTLVKNIVLVHGGFVDGSGWEGVYNVLKKDGYTVAIVQNPTISLPEDVAVTRRAIAALNGPVILVGHSYGGAVITEAGNDPKVVGLVYVTAFALDKGESVASLIKDPPPGATVPPILPPQDGFLFLDRAKFPAAFAGDVTPEAASFMADSQVPWGVEALSGAITQPAWRTKPSWYLSRPRAATPCMCRSRRPSLNSAKKPPLSSRRSAWSGRIARRSEGARVRSLPSPSGKL